MDIPRSSLFEALVQEAEVGVIVTRASDGMVIYVNEAYTRNFDESADELIGQTVMALDLWPSEELRLEWRDRVLREGKATQRFDFTLPNGRSGASTLLTQLVSLNEIDYLVSYNIDMHSLRDAEQQNEEVLKRLNRAYEIAHMADFVYSAETRRITGTQQFSKILRLDEGQNGLTVEEFVSNLHPEDRDQVRDVLNSDPDQFRFSYRYRLRGDEYIWIETIGSVRRDELGQMRSWEGSFQDITQRRRAEEEKQQLERKIQEAQKLESLALLAGGVAHDFNNLLVGIMGNADFALMEPDLPERLKQRLEDIVVASQRAADLTNQLLAYSGRGRFVIQQTDLSSLVREMGQLVGVSVSKSSELNYLLEEDLPPVSVDQTQIRQVVMNLIINASEAIDHDHGKISVATSLLDASPDRLSELGFSDSMTPGRYCVLEVTDNGCGMTEDTRRKLFEPFFTTKFTGRGLGMSAVLGIVRGHQGDLSVESKPGEGTCFRVYLPVDGSADPAEPRSIETRRNSALVVDDDRMIADLLANALGKMGLDVLVCTDGKAAVEAFEANASTLALVMLDLSMPGLDGLKVFSRIKAIDPDARVVLMSGYNQQETVDHWQGQGFDGFLQKPFRLAELKSLVSPLIADRS